MVKRDTWVLGGIVAFLGWYVFLREDKKYISRAGRGPQGGHGLELGPGRGGVQGWKGSSRY